MFSNFIKLPFIYELLTTMHTDYAATPISAELIEKLHQLSEKYAAMGQDMTSYLEGLLQADYLTYWDYIHLETLLSLQNPRTAYPDELIFITYHQITELYFKLIRHEIEQIANRITGLPEPLSTDFFTERMVRINRYFEILERSFSIMIEGMEKEQFLKFRMALLPSSGFQSVQFRQLEIMSTDFSQLLTELPADLPKETARVPMETLYEFIYWKRGATEMASRQKTLTLKQFEARYSPMLIRLAEQYQYQNLRYCLRYLQLQGTIPDTLTEQLREYDHRVNVRWKLSHLRSAVRYLHKAPDVIEATGGTNWQRYLPPVDQRRLFFPELWTETELAQWGRMSIDGFSPTEPTR